MAVVAVTKELLEGLIQEGLSGDNKKLVEAENLLMQLINKEPDQWVPLFYLASVYLQTGRHGLAIQLLHRVSEKEPTIAEVWNNLGTAYRKEHINDKALEYMMKALNLRPDADYYNNVGTLFVNEGTPDKGIEYLSKAVELSPHHTEARWNLGLCLLEKGQWKEGFDHYAWGQLKNRVSKDYGLARWWDGKPHPGKKLVIFGEQGIGDEIMFASCIPDVLKIHKEVIFDCHPRLLSMFERAFPGVKCYPTRKEYDTEVSWAKDENPSFKISIGNLPKFFRKEESDFPKAVYMKPDERYLSEYREKLAKEFPGKTLIGLSWVGGHKHTRKDLRAIQLEEMKGIIDQFPDAVFISLQYTDHGFDDTEKFFADHGVRIHHYREITESTYWESYRVMRDGVKVAEYKDKDAAKWFMVQTGDNSLTLEHDFGNAYNYDQTAALAAAIDERGAIVSVNTSLVHLCGAMGFKCFVLTPSKPAWRYNLDRKDMVWYGPHITQYRQIGESWDQAFSQLTHELKEYLCKMHKEAA